MKIAEKIAKSHRARKILLTTSKFKCSEIFILTREKILSKLNEARNSRSPYQSECSKSV
jgi:hypothetical protein